MLADPEGVTESSEVCTVTDAMRAESIFSLLTIAACVSAGSIHRRDLATQRYFGYFDEDGNGFITASELKVKGVQLVNSVR